MSQMTSADDDDEQNKTVIMDDEIARNALIGAWKESDGSSHVLALEDYEPNDELHLTWEVRDHARDDDCIHATDVADYYVEDGVVVEYDAPDTLEIGGVEYDVRRW